MTSSRIAPWANTQKLAVTWLKSALDGDASVGTRVPADLEGITFVWVVRRPGAVGYVTSTSRIEIHTFSPTEDDGWDVAASVHAAMRDLGGSTVEGQLIDTTRCTADPVEVFWSPTVFRTVGTYELDLRVAG